MNITKLLFVALISYLSVYQVSAQPSEDKLGAWYMYFWNTSIKETPWGFQGDIQFRNWDLGGDLEQLLLRGGVTYKPTTANIKFTLGYGHITTGTYGSENGTTTESRIYQEALFPNKIGGRFYLTHRVRYEQRFVEAQDFRTRYRYNLFLNVPLNKKEIVPTTFYLAFYNELFINGQRDVGNGNTVALFDRNRFYTAIGYAIKQQLKVQLGVMRQSTNNWTKNQLQVSLHQTW
ncbi:MAG: DUF2490 domain-containing protein [Cyclobacteriaceae bacterium]